MVEIAKQAPQRPERIAHHRLALQGSTINRSTAEDSSSEVQTIVGSHRTGYSGQPQHQGTGKNSN